MICFTSFLTLSTFRRDDNLDRMAVKPLKVTSPVQKHVSILKVNGMETFTWYSCRHFSWFDMV